MIKELFVAVYELDGSMYLDLAIVDTSPMRVAAKMHLAKYVAIQKFKIESVAEKLK